MVLTGTSKTKSLVYTALFAVLIVVCTWIQIPAAVPFTLQTFAVFAATLMLGWKRALAAVAVYVALGAVGLPVFSGFRGGLGALAGPTGGYIVGFFFIALSFLLTKIKPGSRILEIASLIIGLVICYAFGTAWFVVVYAKNGGSMSFASALALCVLPYIIPDLLKLALAFFLTAKVKKRLTI
ncbi:MAG: biotin transporter BioY [Oscillospiraceae bacterium]|nr:biotin transporter BioY [Oscillospiraceae bacterium]